MHPVDLLFSHSTHLPILRALRNLDAEGVHIRELTRILRDQKVGSSRGLISNSTVSERIRVLEKAGFVVSRSGLVKEVSLNKANLFVVGNLIPLLDYEGAEESTLRLRLAQSRLREQRSLTMVSAVVYQPELARITWFRRAGLRDPGDIDPVRRALAPLWEALEDPEIKVVDYLDTPRTIDEMGGHETLEPFVVYGLLPMR